MSKEPPFEVVFSEENQIGIDLSDDFVALSTEEQLKVIEAFFWEKTLEQQKAYDVSADNYKHEITIILAECIMAKLKRGERFERGTQVDIDFNVLENLGNIIT